MSGQILRLTRKVQVDGQAHYNVLHFFNGSFNGNDVEEALAHAFTNPVAGTSVNHAIREAMQGAGSVANVGLSIQQISPTLQDPVELALPTYTPTLQAGLPSFCAIVHNVRTAQGGRSRRGRFFVGGIPEAWTTGNILQQAGQDIHGSIDSALMSFFRSGGANYTGFDFGIWSRKLNTFAAAVSSTSTPVIAVMRRRKHGRGI
jgi:hypothetical protein